MKESGAALSPPATVVKMDAAGSPAGLGREKRGQEGSIWSQSQAGS